MIRISNLLLLSCLMTVASGDWKTAHAQSNFYEGKTIRLIVGFTAGGGYDAYTRTIGRHMGKHIPGNPVMIVENMPGAGSMISANYVYKAAKPDGLTIGHFIGGLFLQQLLGKPGIEFDAAKFQYVGVPGQDNFVIGIAKSTGITDVESWLASQANRQVRRRRFRLRFGRYPQRAQGNTRTAYPTCLRLQRHRRRAPGV